MPGLSCDSCGFENPHAAHFCQQCGAPLQKTTEENIPHNEPVGERRPVTILFTDIVDSTSIAEKLDPEEWMEIVSGAHRIVGESVRQIGGTIAQFLGDGVLAYFGAPQTHEDDPQRAVMAALAIQRALQDYRRELAGMVDDFQMRIGIHTGMVVVGEVGDGQHAEYLAVGDAVNLASRLQGVARPGGVLISGSVAHLAWGVFDLSDAGEIAVKGREEPVHVYEVIGSSEKVFSKHGVPGLSCPMIGREVELGVLLSALDRLSLGSGRIVFVLGEAGIGKSRLVEEARCAAPTSARWLEGRSLSYGKALSYWAIRQLVLSDLGLSDGDPALRQRLALRRRLEELLPDRSSQLLPYLTYLLGVEENGAARDEISTLGGETFKHQLFRSITEYFSVLASHQPLAIVLEDFDWADPSTLEVVDQLLGLTNHAPLLLLLVGRTDRQHASWRLKNKAETDYAHRCDVIQLQPLPSAELDTMVQNLLGSPHFNRHFFETITAHSDGNPLYLEELLRSQIDQGTLAWEGSHWALARKVENIEIPDTLQGVLLARIDRLDNDVRRTLQLASVIGRSFLYLLLQAISESGSQLERHLDELQRVDLVREKARFPELEYIFKHSLVQEAAYSSMLIEQRREYHLRVADALESLFPDRLREFYGFLAHHYDLAGERQKAMEYYQLAGDKARLEYSFEEAIRYYERLVGLQSDLGDGEAEARTWLKLGLVHQSDFRFKQAAQAYEEAFQLQRQSVDSPLDRFPIDSFIPGGRIFRVGILWDRVSLLDPGRAPGNNEGDIIKALFAGLVEFDLEANVVPHLARSWDVLDGGRRYIFHLRDDACWTDGNQVDAFDFEFSWKRTLAPGNPEYPANLLDVISCARDYRRGVNPDPDRLGVRALDDRTLEVRLESPIAYFINLMAFPIAYPLPHHIVEQYGDEWWKPPRGVYNGPFRLVEFETDSGQVARNPGYFGDYPGNLDGFCWEQVSLEQMASGDTTVLRRFIDGHLDYCSNVNPDEFDIPIPKIYQRPQTGLLTRLMLLNPARPPLDDLRARKALVYGLDKARIQEAMLHSTVTRLGGGMIPPGIMGHSPELGLPFDLPLARQLMAEAGYPGGKDFPALKIGVYSFDHGVRELKSQLQENLGIELVNVNIPEDGVLHQDFRQDFPDAHVVIMIWGADYPDPDNFVRQSAAIIDLDSWGWSDEHYLQLVEEASHSSDRLRRMSLYREADRILVNEQVLVVPIDYNHQGESLVQPSLGRIERDILGSLLYKHVKLDR